MSEMLKFVVISDIHLVERGGHSKGLDPAERLRSAVDSVNANHADADFCVLAGDLCDRGAAEAYGLLHEIMAPLSIPLYITLGNHDDRRVYKDVYPGAVLDEGGFAQHAIDAKGQRVIVLDSSEPEIVEGVLCETRLAWLAARLEEARDRPVIVVLHHHTNPLSMTVDRIRLRAPERLVEVLKTHPDVRNVIAGHVHCPTTALWHGIPFTTIGGNHYPVSAHVTGTPGRQIKREGPSQYAVVLADAEGCLVHFWNHIDRHIALADGLFAKPAPATPAQ